MKLAMKPPPIALAVLGVAFVWYYTQRKAAAGGVPSGRTGTVLAPSGQSGATNFGKSFLVPVNNALRLPTATATQAGGSQTAGAVLANGLSLISNIFGGSAPTTRWSSPVNVGMSLEDQYAAYGQGRAVGYAGGEITRPADYVASYTPDTAGEAAAQAYFTSNPDEFISNPPATVVYSDANVASTGGWLDSQ